MPEWIPAFERRSLQITRDVTRRGGEISRFKGEGGGNEQAGGQTGVGSPVRSFATMVADVALL